MKEHHNNLVLIGVAGGILLMTNLGIWMASQNGMISPALDMTIWCSFAALNVASILWAVTLLGQQPMMVSMAYLAGGGIAFMGVNNMGGVSMADVATAGASCGAFGALTIGNLTHKGRMSIFNRRQLPFIFCIMVLIFINAALLCTFSGAGGRVLLGTAVYPFVVAGSLVTVLWAVVHRCRIARVQLKQPIREEAATSAGAADTEAVSEVQAGEAAMLFQVPEQSETDYDTALPTDDDEAGEEEPTRVEIAAVAADPTLEEDSLTDTEFYPLEIDNEEESEATSEHAALAAMLADLSVGNEEYENHGLLESVTDQSSVESSTLLDETPGTYPLDDATVSEQEGSELNMEQPPLVTSEISAESTEKKESEDWLSDHLNLLNQLK